MSSEERVLLVGLGPTALSALAALADHFGVAGLVRGPADDGSSDEVRALARRLGVPVHDDASIDGIRRVVALTDPDVVVVSSYNRILPAEMLGDRPWVNVHYAPLPRYRGRAVVNWAIINGETDAFVTVHSLVAGLDSGGVLAQSSIPILPRDTVTDLYERLNTLQAELLPLAVSRRLSGDAGEPQDEALATYCCTRVPADGEIDWSASADDIDRLVRSLTSPYPGAFTHLGLRRIVVHRAEPAGEISRWVGRVPGRVVRVDRHAGHVDVLAGEGVLRIHEVSSANGHVVQASSVIRSVSSTLGLRLSDLVDALVQMRDSQSTP